MPWWKARSRRKALDDDTPACRLLVVDDEEEIGAYFRSVMRRLAHLKAEVVVESDPAAVLERVKRERFDVVVSDFHMPKVDGLSVLDAARHRNPDGLRVLLTGFNTVPANLARVRRAEIDAFLQKPVHSQDLQIFLFDFLDRHDEAIAAWREKARAVEDEAAGRGDGLSLAGS